jgi:sterol desaturase/sphingolipid hydroxylase (fatty acid hydroxylase superfamily)
MPLPETADALRLGLFLGLLLLLLVLERCWPRRGDAADPVRRWTANLGLAATGSLLVQLLPGAGAVGAALWAQQQEIGLLPALGLGPLLQGLAGLVLLDLLIYAQHRLFHRLPLFWRLHRVHHSDLKLDATTGLRFHPFEIGLSLLLKMAAVALLGVPPLGVLLFEVLLNGLAMFNHADLALPPRLEAWLRPWLVTPDLHRIHHSIHRDETDSNYGVSVTFWDRAFGSYRDQPREGQPGLRLGLPEQRAPLGLAGLLRWPLR